MQRKKGRQGGPCMECPVRRASFCVAVDEAETCSPRPNRPATRKPGTSPRSIPVTTSSISPARRNRCASWSTKPATCSSSTEPAGGASAWSIAEVQKGVAIDAVSCTRESLCVAVDEAGDVLSSSNPTGGAGAWSVVHVDEHGLSAVSCASESLCVATNTERGRAHRDEIPPVPPMPGCSRTSTR